MVSRLRTLGSVGCALSVVLLGACGGSQSVRDQESPVQRGGGNIESIQYVYLDESPELSADGTKGVFVSGRSSTTSVALLKVYKFGWPADGAPGVPTRLTAVDDLGDERLATIAPDGSYVAIFSVVSGQSDLYLKDFDGENSAVRLTNDALTERRAFFSSDSATVAWLASDTSGASAVWSVTVADFIADPTIAPTRITAESERVVDFSVVRGSGGDQLLIKAVSSETRSTVLTTRDWTKPAATAAATSVAWSGEDVFAGNVTPALADIGLALDRPSRLEGRTVARSGDFVEETTATLPVRSGPALVSSSDGSQTVIEDARGFRLESVAIASGSGIGFWTGQQLYRCQIDGKSNYASFMHLALLAGGGTTSLVPQTSDAGATWSIADRFAPRPL